MPEGRVSKSTKVVLGGIAGIMATSLVHPLDVIKIRLQLFPRKCSTVHMAREILKCEGGRALYTGLSAGIMRQATYTTTRLAVYNWFYDDYKRKHSKNPALKDKVFIGIFAGLAGAFTGNPSEVALVRLMADGRKEPCRPTKWRPRYKGVFDAFYKIIRDEGVCALWRGGALTMARSVFLSAAQLGSYERIRDHLKAHKVSDPIQLHLYTSISSSLITAFVSLPVDLIKTKYQVRNDGFTQMEILTKFVDKKGIPALWKGFLPYFIRMATHTILTYIFLEEMTLTYLEFKRELEEKKKK